MKIDKKTNEVLTYKVQDIIEGINALINAGLDEATAKDLQLDLIKQLEELKLVLISL